MFLVDTNVISITAPRRLPASSIAEWMDTHSAEIFLSVATIAEIEDGIAKSRQEGAVRKAAELTKWFELIMYLYADRILTFDRTIARVAGAMAATARGAGQEPGFADIIIAATARHHGLVILSRSLRHFEPLGVAAVDPFVALP